MFVRLIKLATLVAAFAIAPLYAQADTGAGPTAMPSAPATPGAPAMPTAPHNTPTAPHATLTAAHAAATHPLHFVVNIMPHNSKSVPWTGDMTLKINPEGIINGTYRSTSTRPDPFHGKIITVTGGLTGGKNIHLEFGAKGYFPVKGEYHTGQGIVGTARLGSGPPAATSMMGPSSMSGSRYGRPSTLGMSQPTNVGGLYDFIAKQEAK